jgi:hypothetical protein
VFPHFKYVHLHLHLRKSLRAESYTSMVKNTAITDCLWRRKKEAIHHQDVKHLHAYELYLDEWPSISADQRFSYTFRLKGLICSHIHFTSNIFSCVVFRAQVAGDRPQNELLSTRLGRYFPVLQRQKWKAYVYNFQVTIPAATMSIQMHRTVTHVSALFESGQRHCVVSSFCLIILCRQLQRLTVMIEVICRRQIYSIIL